jgi:type I restriction enzyme, S subunit
MEAVMDKIEIEKYAAYKNSGIEWMDNMPAHWDALSNKFIFQLKKSQVGKRANEYVLLSLTLNGIIKRDMENPQGKFPAEFDTYQEVKEGDFVFCLFDVEETPRAVGLSTFNGMITGAYTVMEPKKEFDKKFLYYFYLNLDTDKRLKPLYKGLRNVIPKEAFFSFKTFVPPIEEQTAIANFLDRKTAQIDNAIAQKEKLIDLLKERRQILIHKAVTQGLNPEVRMKDSGVEWIGEIPEHWKVAKLKFISEFINDGTHGTYPRVEDGYRLLSVRNMVEDKFIFLEDDSKVSERHFKEISAKFEIQEGDVQLAIVGATLGKVALVERMAEKFVTQRSVATIRLKNGVYLAKLLFYFMKSLCFQSYLWLNAGFSAQPGIYLGTVADSYITVMDMKEQIELVTYLDGVSKKFQVAIAAEEVSINKLKEYKQTLINAAVTGKIKVN